MAEVINAKKGKRKSYIRELKLSAIKWYNDNGKNICQTAEKFEVDRKQICNWVAMGTEIHESKTFTRKISSGRKAFFPEEILHQEFLEI